MKGTFSIDKTSDIPIYKQIYMLVETGIRNGSLAPGQMLYSMNDFAGRADISRETVKKAYNLLCRDNLIIPHQGKGFFVADNSSGENLEILVLLDKQTIYNQQFVQSLQSSLSPQVHYSILLYNQDVDLFEYYLDKSLDKYDYYIISPHFPLDGASQAKAAKLLKRVPNHKMIMVDNWIRKVPGNYGVVYQDFAKDVITGLSEGKKDIVRSGRIKVVLLPSSLYGVIILESVRELANEWKIGLSVFNSIPESFEKGDVVLVLNSQLDTGLVILSRCVKECGLKIGTDVKVITYNEFPLNEVVLGGLTTLSTDYVMMGEHVATMIKSGKMSKIHNEFRMTRRHTF